MGSMLGMNPLRLLRESCLINFGMGGPPEVEKLQTRFNLPGASKGSKKKAVEFSATTAGP